MKRRLLICAASVSVAWSTGLSGQAIRDAQDDGLRPENVERLNQTISELVRGEQPSDPDCETCWNAWSNNDGWAHIFSPAVPQTPSGYNLINSVYMFKENHDLELEELVPPGHSFWVSGKCDWYHVECFGTEEFQAALATASEGDFTHLKAFMAANPNKVQIHESEAYLLFGCSDLYGSVYIGEDARRALVQERGTRDRPPVEDDSRRVATPEPVNDNGTLWGIN